MDTFTDQFLALPENRAFLKANMMGPDAMRVAEELGADLGINETMRILDLGCGCGLSTLLLTKKYQAQVLAADLWISPSENYERFRLLAMDDKAIPVFADATKGLPFAQRYFDLLFSVDAYHYFGDTVDMLPRLVPFVKHGGYIAVAIPGLKYEFGKDVPAAIQPFWNSEMARTLHSPGWWEALWRQTAGIELITVREMACCQLAWQEWLTGDHPIVAGDIKMMQAEDGKYFNLIQLVAKVI